MPPYWKRALLRVPAPVDHTADACDCPAIRRRPAHHRVFLRINESPEGITGLPLTRKHDFRREIRASPSQVAIQIA
ncbi:hypothetical protein KCP75_07315 [Salmonella enterica subsp. enterica]|nr:hypothetical protein KCP75_07315 [Salmonella enterica subsp. enterica]